MSRRWSRASWPCLSSLLARQGCDACGNRLERPQKGDPHWRGVVVVFSQLPIQLVANGLDRGNESSGGGRCRRSQCRKYAIDLPVSKRPTDKLRRCWVTLFQEMEATSFDGRGECAAEVAIVRRELARGNRREDVVGRLCTAVSRRGNDRRQPNGRCARPAAAGGVFGHGKSLLSVRECGRRWPRRTGRRAADARGSDGVGVGHGQSMKPGLLDTRGAPVS